MPQVKVVDFQLKMFRTPKRALSMVHGYAACQREGYLFFELLWLPQKEK